eukprot:gnl/TRDRNA2_/TRDRNA2_174351_c0_seq1.p1 gnl/TRDRNA2_/TRDRNA2_174351_c0~~gnl/TRDRNA2_/TRDRNA2_174351_c0_seq1.p1  ORF type:complete len:214 (+),score=50.72 gnl/TRDRNA2_/TRDRNA2_174351_c0_seq1:52-693(+)
MDFVTEEHILEEYGDFAENYEETLQAYGYVTHERAPQMLEDELAKRNADTEARPWRVLDLGCGTGNTAALYFKKPGMYSVVGVDLTPEMVQKARMRPYERVICQNIEDELDVVDSSFDAIQFLGVTEFLNRPRDTFAMAKRKLRKDGLLLVSSPEKISKTMEKKYKIKTWLPGELEDHILQCGFVLLRTEKFLAYDLGDVKVQYACGLWRASD